MLKSVVVELTGTYRFVLVARIPDDLDADQAAEYMRREHGQSLPGEAAIEIAGTDFLGRVVSVEDTIMLGPVTGVVVPRSQFPLRQEGRG
jgi:hypothetical protein